MDDTEMSASRAPSRSAGHSRKDALPSERFAGEHAKRPLRDAVADLFCGDHRHGLGGQTNGIRTPRESQPRHPHIAVQPDPAVRRAKMRSEFPVDLEWAPIKLLPCFESSEKLLALLGADRSAGASTGCVDRHSTRSVEKKLMTTRNMSQPAVLVLEIRWLELKSQDHRRNIEIVGRPHRCLGHIDIGHDSSSFQVPRFPSPRGIGKRASGLKGEASNLAPRQ